MQKLSQWVEVRAHVSWEADALIPVFFFFFWGGVFVFLFVCFFLGGRSVFFFFVCFKKNDLS